MVSLYNIFSLFSFRVVAVGFVFHGNREKSSFFPGVDVVSLRATPQHAYTYVCTIHMFFHPAIPTERKRENKRRAQHWYKYPERSFLNKNFFLYAGLLYT